jgi:hypothetical protein
MVLADDAAGYLGSAAFRDFLAELEPNHGRLGLRSAARKWAGLFKQMAEDLRNAKLQLRAHGIAKDHKVSNRRGVKVTVSESDEQHAKERGRLMHELLLKESEPPFDRRSLLPNETYVYIIPHTHTDLGWLSTVEEYFVKSSRR